VLKLCTHTRYTLYYTKSYERRRCLTNRFTVVVSIFRVAVRTGRDGERYRSIRERVATDFPCASTTPDRPSLRIASYGRIARGRHCFKSKSPRGRVVAPCENDVPCPSHARFAQRAIVFENLAGRRLRRKIDVFRISIEPFPVFKPLSFRLAFCLHASQRIPRRLADKV